MKDVVTLPRLVPLLPDLHQRGREGQGLLGARGRDALPEPLRRHILPRRPARSGLARGARRLSARDRGVRCPTTPARRVHRAADIAPEGRPAPLPRLETAVVRGVLRDDAAPRVEDRAPDARPLPGAKADRSGTRGTSSTSSSSESSSASYSTPTSTSALPRCDADGGRRAGAIKTLEDIARLPLLSKQDVRRGLYFDLFADDHDKRRMQRISTSGSTGEPFVTYGDQYQLEFRFATTLRALEWTGWRFGDRQARLWHQTIGMSRLEVVRERIDAWFMRRLFVPAYEMAPDQLEEFVGRIRDIGLSSSTATRSRSTFSPTTRQRAAGPASRPRRSCPPPRCYGKLPRRDRAGIRRPRVRQVRKSRVLGHRIRVLRVARPPRDGRELHRRASRRRASSAARRDGRGRHHRPQQLLRPADPIPDRRPGSRRRQLEAAARAAGRSRASGASKAAHRRSSTARTARGCPARSSRISSRTTSTRSGSSRFTKPRSGTMTLRLVKNLAVHRGGSRGAARGAPRLHGKGDGDPGRVRRRDPARGDRASAHRSCRRSPSTSSN